LSHSARFREHPSGVAAAPQTLCRRQSLPPTPAAHVGEASAIELKDICVIFNPGEGGEPMKRISVQVAFALLLGVAVFAQSNGSQSSAQTSNTSQNSSQMSGQKNSTMNQNSADTNSNIALPGGRERLGGSDPTARISREVLHQLLMDPYYSVFDNLSYRVEGNTVTLMGQVINPATKSNAESNVKQVEGVDKVVNNIEVLPPSPGDDRIRRAELNAIYGFDGLSRYSGGAVPSIHIIVHGGHVTLVGVVDKQADKDMVGLRARQVPGVFSVENNLRVATETAEK
jgi:hyperosmotically inducible protein